MFDGLKQDFGRINSSMAGCLLSLGRPHSRPRALTLFPCRCLRCVRVRAAEQAPMQRADSSKMLANWKEVSRLMALPDESSQLFRVTK